MYAVLFFPLLLHLGASSAPAGGDPASRQGAGTTYRTDRVYSLERLNGKAVPAEVEFRSTAGSRHWVRMEEAVLRLRRDGSFTASARFYRELVQAGRRPPPLGSMRLLNDNATGRYTVRGDTVVLVTPKRRDGSGGTAYGRVTGDRLRIRHTLRDGNIRHDVDIVLRIDPSIW
jgi:hypothetical protein